MDYVKVVGDLIRQSEDAGATPAEAKTFLDKAIEIMAKEGIDRAMVDSSKPVADVMMDLIKQFDAPYAISKADLFIAIAIAFRCKVIKLRDKKFHFFGYTSDIERAEFLYTTLLLHGVNTLTQTRVSGNPKSFSTSWWAGYASEIGSRLSAANKVVADSTPGSAVVLFNRAQASERAMRTAYPRTTKSAGRSLSSSSGFTSGKVAGSKVSLGSTSLGSTTRRAVK